MEGRLAGKKPCRPQKKPPPTPPIVELDQVSGNKAPGPLHNFRIISHLPKKLHFFFLIFIICSIPSPLVKAPPPPRCLSPASGPMVVQQSLKADRCKDIAHRRERSRTAKFAFIMIFFAEKTFWSLLYYRPQKAGPPRGGGGEHGRWLGKGGGENICRTTLGSILLMTGPVGASEQHHTNRNTRRRGNAGGGRYSLNISSPSRIG